MSNSLSDPASVLLDMADMPGSPDHAEASTPTGGMSNLSPSAPSHLRTNQPASGAPFLSSLPIPSPNSNHIPLGSSFEPKLKDGITKGLYVPIDIILVSEQGGNIDSYLCNTTHMPGNDSCNHTFYLSLNIDRWTNGFLIFAAIWISAFPHQCLAPLHYIPLIRSMAKNTPGPV